MDKKTLIAVVLSVVVISVGFFIQTTFYSPEQTQSVEGRELAAEREVSSEVSEETGEEPVLEDTKEKFSESEAVIADSEEGSAEEREIEVETDLYRITFLTKGAIISSLKLKQHATENDLVDIIRSNDPENGAFYIHFGGPDSAAIDTPFQFKQIGKETYEFTKDFYAPGENGEKGEKFTLRKVYEFKPGEYLFELRVTIENSVKEYPNLNYDGYAYTLQFGPQIGPDFDKLDMRQAYRKFFVYQNEKRDEIKVSRDGITSVDERIGWAALAGKYFALIGIPDATLYKVSFLSRAHPELVQESRIFFSRPVIKSSKNTDVYRFYAGPKTKQQLSRYNQEEKNSFNIRGLNLDSVMDRRVLLGWLENILKFFLNLFYKIIPNYGIAIILLTILIKILLFPITHKSYESTSKMQQINPKIQELRDKFKDNPQKMNQEMAALYKKEGVNPLGGCLPLLLQMPVFIALYGLLNNHFELRGAEFIVPWITDLSSPDSILNFAPTQIPILGWSDIRLLPILFVGTQLISSKILQNPGASSNSQMKMITYVLPLVFFFVLYDAPSGLLLYWTVTNLLTVVQQYFITKRREKSAEA